MADACAFGEDATAMLFNDRLDDKEPQPRSLDPRHDTSGRAIEAFEDALDLFPRNANPAIRNSDEDVFGIGRCHFYEDAHLFVRILDGVIEQVRNGCT